MMEENKIIKIMSICFLSVGLILIINQHACTSDIGLPRISHIKEISFLFIESVEIDHKGGDITSRREIIIRSDDKKLINEFYDVIKNPELTTDHKCGDWFYVKFLLLNGQIIKLGLLEGHDDKYYEMRFNRKIYKFDRKQIVNFFKKWKLSEKYLWNTTWENRFSQAGL